MGGREMSGATYKYFTRPEQIRWSLTLAPLLRSVGLQAFGGSVIVPFQTNRTGNLTWAPCGRSRGSLIVAVDPCWKHERRQRRRCAFRSWLDNGIR